MLFRPGGRSCLCTSLSSTWHTSGAQGYVRDLLQDQWIGHMAGREGQQAARMGRWSARNTNAQCKAILDAEHRLKDGLAVLNLWKHPGAAGGSIRCQPLPRMYVPNTALALCTSSQVSF